MNRLWRGIRWEENSDELYRDGGVQELIGLRTRTLSGLGTSLDLDLGRVINFLRTRNLVGSGNFRQMTPFRNWITYRTDLQRARNAFSRVRDLPELELYRFRNCTLDSNFAELYGNFIALDYLMNFLRITR